MTLKKCFYKLLNNAFYGKTMENVRNRCKIEIIKRDEYDKILKQQRKLTFNGMHKSFNNCDSYLFKEREILLDILILYNHTLVRKKYNYIMWTVTVLF